MESRSEDDNDNDNDNDNDDCDCDNYINRKIYNNVFIDNVDSH